MALALPIVQFADLSPNEQAVVNHQVGMYSQGAPFQLQTNGVHMFMQWQANGNTLGIAWHRHDWEAAAGNAYGEASEAPGEAAPSRASPSA
jgi:hypothetical protein